MVANDIPFGGPPPEPGLSLPRTGFFGWVAQVQKDFYIALTAALGRLKSDWTAFWVLGSLSFLYGIFHAAGPGHGKIVISSYVLANEQQVRRGIVLSFLSAMMQSGVAVGFVLVLSLLLGLTSMALSDAANWIGISVLRDGRAAGAVADRPAPDGLGASPHSCTRRHHRSMSAAYWRDSIWVARPLMLWQQAARRSRHSSEAGPMSMAACRGMSTMVTAMVTTTVTITRMSSCRSRPVAAGASNWV